MKKTLLLFWILIAPLSARADTLSFEAINGGSFNQAFAVNSGFPYWTGSYSNFHSAFLPQFDPLLGTLNNVSIDYSLGYGLTLTQANLQCATSSGCGVYAHGGATGQFQVASGGNTLQFNWNKPQQANNCGIVGTTGSCGPVTVFGLQVLTGLNGNLVGPLNAFVGNGNVSFGWAFNYAYGAAIDVYPNTVAASGTLTLNDTWVARIHYDYTPFVVEPPVDVPEPMMLGLLGLGLGVMGRRRVQPRRT